MSQSPDSQNLSIWSPVPESSESPGTSSNSSGCSTPPKQEKPVDASQSIPSSTRPSVTVARVREEGYVWLDDHFFVLKVEPEAYYIIDTLGERLYEGCNEAYVLRFDRDTRICSGKEEDEEEGVLCEGKESCRDYIKKFLAAIPIRELEADVKKDLVKSSVTPLHHRLQIEFHFTCK